MPSIPVRGEVGSDVSNEQSDLKLRRALCASAPSERSQYPVSKLELRVRQRVRWSFDLLLLDWCVSLFSLHHFPLAGIDHESSAC